MRVSIQDVAQLAGVAVSTVSRVLNGYRDVSEETRLRVQHAVEQLGYRPNPTARSFRTGKTQSVSVMLPMIGTDFYNRLINGIDQGLAQHDYDAGLFPLLSPRRLERYRNPSAPPYNADGLILASLNPDSLFKGGRVPAGLPTVLVDIAHPDYDSVTVDNVAGGYLAGQHLLERPAPTYVVMIEERFNTPFASGVFRDRLRGFQKAFIERSHPLPETNVVTVEFSWDGGRKAAREIINRLNGPVNIFASCDLLAQGLVDEMHHRGRPVEGEVRLVGYDDQPWTEGYGLSTIRQPIESMGGLAASLLIKRLGRPTASISQRVLSPRLVVRASSAEGR
jgi:LacI family transcriptional regulator